jgi:hypothetical protein
MMSDQAEKIKKLVAFKKKLENRVDELESELRELQTMLETVNIILLEKGFKHAEITKAPAMTETSPTKEEAAEAEPSYPIPTAEYGNIIPLKTFTGELLANLHPNKDSLRVVLAEES